MYNNIWRGEKNQKKKKKKTHSQKKLKYIATTQIYRGGKEKEGERKRGIQPEWIIKLPITGQANHVAFFVN